MIDKTNLAKLMSRLEKTTDYRVFGEGVVMQYMNSSFVLADGLAVNYDFSGLSAVVKPQLHFTPSLIGEREIERLNRFWYQIKCIREETGADVAVTVFNPSNLVEGIRRYATELMQFASEVAMQQQRETRPDNDGGTQ